MATDKQTYNLETYKKKLKEAKEEYEKRKDFLASFSLPKNEEEDDEGSEESSGSAEKEPEGGIGNFVGTGELVCPAENKTYRYTSGYGIRKDPFGNASSSTHWGVDLAPATKGATNCKILAAGDGAVVAAGPASGFGHWIVIKHKDTLYTIYGHMPKSSMKVKVGDQVKKGQHIAMMGTEGTSTGVHLHFEVTKNFGNRKGKGADGTFNTIDPETVIDIRSGMVSMEFKRDQPKINSLSISSAAEETNELELGESMHSDYGHLQNFLTEEGKKIDNIFKEKFNYRPVSFVGNILRKHSEERSTFLLNRVGWARSSNYSGLVALDKNRFIHQHHYDGYEGNLYSPDAKRAFENLLLKTKKPYFEVVSGFRFSNPGQLSPHEAGCAIDIHVKDLDEVRELADCAWVLGIRSIGIGGDFEQNKGFIHLDIAPKGKDFMYDGLPIYGGPGKWVEG